MFTGQNATALIAWLVLVFWQISKATNTQSSRQWYTLGRKRVPGAPPGWVFGIAWFILFGLMTASFYLYFTPDDGYEDSQYFLATFILVLVNLMLNKYWSMVFFDRRNASMALVLMVALLLTAIAIAVLLGLSDAWVPFGLFILYPVWLVYAGYLNLQWVRKGLVAGPEIAPVIPPPPPSSSSSSSSSHITSQPVSYSRPNVRGKLPLPSTVAATNARRYPPHPRSFQNKRMLKK